MPNAKRIFIVGQSGAGKGVLAQALAEQLGWQFIDADFALAPTIGRNLDEIISTQGVTAFQNCLAEILSAQIKMDNIVVTTDDSIVCSEKNRQLLKSEFCVFLQVSTSVQLDRIAHNRPLLANKDYTQFLNELHQERDPLYEQVASFSISSDNGAIDEHVSSIIKKANE